jgi:hypothetical protein
MTEKLQARVTEGISNLTVRIEGAGGKRSEYQPPVK